MKSATAAPKPKKPKKKRRMGQYQRAYLADKDRWGRALARGQVEWWRHR